MLAALVLTGCGYSLAGRGNFLPDYIQVISIPEFQNRSDHIELERIVTENKFDLRSEINNLK